MYFNADVHAEDRELEFSSCAAKKTSFQGIIIIMQRLTRRVSVVRMTNRRRDWLRYG